MEDPFNRGTFSDPADRLARMRDLIDQIKADYETYRQIVFKLEAGKGDESDLEELQRITVWLKNNLFTYRKLNSRSIEGIIYPALDEISREVGAKD